MSQYKPNYKPTLAEFDEFSEKFLMPAFAHLCQSDAMAEDHSERMQPYEGDAGDETN